MLLLGALVERAQSRDSTIHLKAILFQAGLLAFLYSAETRDATPSQRQQETCTTCSNVPCAYSPQSKHLGHWLIGR